MTTQLHFRSPMEFDMALQEPVFNMSRRGLRVDLAQRELFSAEYHEKWDTNQLVLNNVVGHPLNVQSNPQMLSWLYDELRLPARLKGGRLTADEDALRALLAICEEQMSVKKTAAGREKYLRGHMSIMLILRIRGARKVTSSYTDVEVDPDGRWRSLIVVGKVETARFSASKTLWGTGLNLMTMPKKLRRMIIPDDGMELAEFDLNRGESWIYAHLANDPELIRIHQSNGDFHSETAVAVASAFDSSFSTLEEFKALKEVDYERHFKLRYVGKRVNHASAYRMGPFRGAELINQEADDTGITVTVGQMKEAQRLWREKYFMMPEWWNGIERKLDEDRTLTTPYGRRRTFYGFWGDHLFKEATAYVPQATSVDYINIGLLRVWHELHKKGLLELLHQNHDSILIQYKQERRDEVMPEVIERLKSKVVVNGWEISIPVDASYGMTWAGNERKDQPGVFELVEWKG